MATAVKDMAEATTPLSDLSIVDPAIVRCPYPFYRRLHAEAPVHRDATTGMWLISRYTDLQAATRDVATFSNDTVVLDRRPRAVPAEAQRIFAEEAYARPQCLQRNDPPRHTRFRKLVDRAFTASRVKALKPYIDAVVADLIDKMIAAGCDGPDGIDYAAHFAVPLPCIVIADQLGVDRADIPLLKTWTDALLDPIGMMIDEKREIECARQVVEFQKYFAARIAERRAEPRDDILSALAARLDGEDPFTTEEILNLLEQLMTGGNETTTATLSAAMLLLIEHSEAEAKLRAEPGLIGNFVEEAIRLETPVQGLFRQTTRDVEVSGVTIPRGDIVMLRYGAVNRDPLKFADPDRFDVARGNAGAHLAFGAGAHFCPGAMLARQELASAFTQLLDRFASFELLADPVELTYRPSFFLRGLKSLPLRLTLNSSPRP